MYRSASSSFQLRDNKQSNEVKKDIKNRKPFSLYISGNGDNQSDSSNKKNNNSNSDDRFLSSINIDPKNHTTTITRMDTDQKNSNKSSKSKNVSSNNERQNSDTNKQSNNVAQAQQNLGIPSDSSYIDINDAKSVVNQSNGLTVTPTQTFNSNGQQFNAGQTVTLNGEQALAYAKGGGSNQHQLLSSFVSKNSDIKSFLTPGRIKEISSYTKTNLSPDDISQLYQHYRGALQNIQYK